jgi:hypothetical protein
MTGYIDFSNCTKSVVLLICFSKVIVLLTGMYSCLLFRIRVCNAYAD